MGCKSFRTDVTVVTDDNFETVGFVVQVISFSPTESTRFFFLKLKCYFHFFVGKTIITDTYRLNSNLLPAHCIAPPFARKPL
jgi:hypothetical protein